MKSALSQTMMKSIVQVSGCLLVAGLLAGCASTANSSKGSKGPKYVFFPPAPDDPHVQFLTSFASEKDLGGRTGTFMTYLTGQQPQVLPIVKPYGGFAGGGKIYICDTGLNAITKMDLVARRMALVLPDAAGAIQTPLNMAVDDNGWLYVVDMGRQQLVILDDKEHFVTTVGEKGKNKPLDVALTKDRIYLSDENEHCVHVMDKASRKNLFDIPRAEDATNWLRRLYQPINIAVDQKGRLYVSDFGASQVKVFDADGKYVRSVGQHGSNLGDFFRNKGVAVDRNNYLYVVDAAFDNVQIFDGEAQLLMPFGGAKADQASMELPAKVLVDYDDVPLFQQYAAPNFQVEHLLIVMNQFGPHKVSVYGFGHKK